MASNDLLERVAPQLESLGVADDAARAALLGRLSAREFAQGDMVLRAGELSDTLYLLESGLVRLYYTTPDGRERNKAFYAGGEITGPVSAAMTGSAAPFSIQCLEDTRALAFAFADLEQASRDYPVLARRYTRMLARAFIRNEQREAMLLTCNAEQRYRWLLQHEGELARRLPQFHIASYLGIDAVSLSRLKRKLRQETTVTP